MAKTDLKDMLAHAVHFGHKTSRWNPNMKRYIHSDRGGVHIIDLSMTATMLDSALEFLTTRAAEGANFLFVGTKPQCFDLVKETCEKTGAYYVTEKWVAGFLTNFSTIKTRVKRLKDLKQEFEENEFERYTKKEGVKLHKEIAKLQAAFGGVEDMKKKPQVLVVLDAKRDQLAITEANKLGIPVVAIVDTNADPETVTYPVPGNDDAIKSVGFFLSKFEEAILSGKKSAPKPKAEKKEAPKEDKKEEAK